MSVKNTRRANTFHMIKILAQTLGPTSESDFDVMSDNFHTEGMCILVTRGHVYPVICSYEKSFLKS
jgi:hypothetical protein